MAANVSRASCGFGERNDVRGHLTSDELDLEGVKLIRSMFKDDSSRKGQMILALCNALEREIRRNAALKEYVQEHKAMNYDGSEKEKG